MARVPVVGPNMVMTTSLTGDARAASIASSWAGSSRSPPVGQGGSGALDTAPPLLPLLMLLLLLPPPPPPPLLPLLSKASPA
jgi:hypothetical protein